MGNETDAQAGESETERTVSDDAVSGSNILVAYFSCTGTTEQIAEWVAEETGAELYEIRPDTPYTEDDLNYSDSSSRANQEQADSSARPAIAGSVENMENYDVIFLGYPIWHGQAPRIISTFLESYDFSDVMMIPFCTSHSSSIGSSAENLHSLCAETVTWEDGRRFPGDAVKSDVEEWIESLELPD
ncbi:MAG: flavodoxin [Clostridiales bacterium]|nr:flavodoxin [Clostridiales bacterium]